MRICLMHYLVRILLMNYTLLASSRNLGPSGSYIIVVGGGGRDNNFSKTMHPFVLSVELQK
jgi:hypothetical protein